MNRLLDMTAPLVIGAVLLYAAIQGTDIYSSLLRGAEKGLKLAFGLIPVLTVLFSAIYLLRSSGLPELLGRLASPLLTLLGIPEETVLLLLLRPFSGSAALAASAELISEYGADSLLGRTAAVMMGASETTLYVAAVYFAAAGVKKSRWAIPAALCADVACFIASAWICRIIWG